MQVLSFKQNKTVTGLCLILVSLTLFVFVASPPAFAQDASSINTLRQMGKAFAAIAEKASPAVVGIEAEKTIATQEYQMYDRPFGDQFDPFGDDFFEHFFGQPRRRQPRSRRPQRKSLQKAQGSGFIISPDGYILTNNHLVGEAEKIIVKLGEEKQLKAEIIGTDPESDVAVIKIDAKDLPFLELADSDALEVGEWVIAIGNPFGLSHSVTAGIVSAKGRTNIGLARYEDFIQTDAAINFGNSGGPLLNLYGKVVGINTAIIGRGGNIGIGFAIPSNMAKDIYEQLVESGTVVRGFLGVGHRDLTPELAEYFGLKEARGVIIAEVVEDSAAEKAGLKHNDIIIEFNGKPVEKAVKFGRRVAMLKPGTEVEIVVLRDGEEKTFTAQLSERPKKTLSSTKSETLEQTGLSVQNLTDDLAERLGYEGLSGVVVTDVEPGSVAAAGGINAGSLIMEVNQKPVRNVKEFNEAMEKAAEKGAFVLLLRDRRFIRYVVLTLPEK